MKKIRSIATLFLFLVPFSLSAQVTNLLLDGGGKNFGPGDKLKLSVGIQHNGEASNVDIYLALLLPDGNILFFSFAPTGNLAAHVGSIETTGWTPLISNLNLIPGLDTGLIPIFNYVFTGQEQLGDYLWLLGITNAGKFNLLGLSSYSFRLGVRETDSLLGKWSGIWKNDTFSSTGAASLTVKHNSTPGTLKLTVDLDGFVGGFIDPEPETIIATINADGTINNSMEIPMLGPVTVNITQPGQVSIAAPKIDTIGFETFDANGSISNGQLNLKYTVTFTGGGSATGTVTGTRE